MDSCSRAGVSSGRGSRRSSASSTRAAARARKSVAGSEREVVIVLGGRRRSGPRGRRAGHGGRRRRAARPGAGRLLGRVAGGGSGIEVLFLEGAVGALEQHGDATLGGVEARRALPAEADALLEQRDGALERQL